MTTDRRTKQARRSTFGSVRRLSSGRFQARHTVAGRLVPAGVFDTEEAAWAHLRVLEAKATLGLSRGSAAANETLNSYADRWLPIRKLRNGKPLAPGTVALYRQLLRTHVTESIGTLPLGRITPDVVTRWYSGISSPTARANSYKLVKTILATAVRDDLLPSSPCRIQGGAIAHTPTRRDPSDADVAAILAHVTEHAPRFRFYLVLAAATGLRQGELAGLRRSDLTLAPDLSGGTLRVERQRVRVQGAAVDDDGKRRSLALVTGPKSGAGVRTLQLAAPVAVAAAKHLAAYVPAAATSADGPLGPNSSDPPIFAFDRFRIVSRASLAAAADALEARTEPKRTGRPMHAATRERLLADAAALRAVRTYADVPAAYREVGLFDGPRFHRTVWRPALEALGIDHADLHVHDLRAYAGTRATRAGANLPEVMMLLGHSTVDAALRYQRSSDPERMAKIAAATAAAMPGLFDASAT